MLVHEAPILDDALVQQITRVNGFQKAGRLIRERVIALAERNHHLQEDPLGGRFVWINIDSPTTWNAYRVPTRDSDARRIEEVSFNELKVAVHATKGPDTALDVARVFGIRRLASVGRERSEAMQRLIKEGEEPRFRIHRFHRRPKATKDHE